MSWRGLQRAKYTFGQGVLMVFLFGALALTWLMVAHSLPTAGSQGWNWLPPLAIQIAGDPLSTSTAPPSVGNYMSNVMYGLIFFASVVMYYIFLLATAGAFCIASVGFGNGIRNLRQEGRG